MTYPVNRLLPHASNSPVANRSDYIDRIKEKGGNPFFDYSVPEAIIKFRQGFGRLIRSKKDYGAVIACDNRLSRMQYGKQFLNSLPTNAEIFFTQDELLKSLDEWFIKKETVNK